MFELYRESFDSELVSSEASISAAVSSAVVSSAPSLSLPAESLRSVSNPGFVCPCVCFLCTSSNNCNTYSRWGKNTNQVRLQYDTQLNQIKSSSLCYKTQAKCCTYLLHCLYVQSRINSSIGSAIILLACTFDFGMSPTLKKPMLPLSILVQSTTVEAMFSGEGPSQSTPSTCVNTLTSL